jgi:DNA-binding MarR family transcriptional regulator
MASAMPDPITQEIIGLVVGLTERMRAHFAKVTADFGLSPMEGRALFRLEEPLPMGELADTLHCDASYITGVTNRLEEQGLVERQVAADDRRVKHLVLTTKGKQLREAMQLRAERELPATAGLTSEQRMTLRDLLRAIRHAGPAVQADNVDTAC